jgi:uncharacterized protein YyaL (SSP411 family)
MNTFKVTTLLSVLIIASSFTANTNELKWLGWNEGYDLAKKKNKIAVVDVYTDWCGWCKVMDRETFAKPEVIDLINKEFVPVKFNPEAQGSYTFNGKQYTGSELAALISNNQLSGYPSTVFYFPKTNEFKMEVGFKNPQAFTEILNDMVKYKASAAAKKK